MFSEFLFDKRWIDLSGARKMATLVWLILAGVITITLTLAIYREVLDKDTTRQAILFAIVFSLIFVGMYHYGIYQWQRATMTGSRMENRSKTKIIAALICIIGFICLFIANTGNLHYFLTAKEATKNDIRELNTKVRSLEDTVGGFLTSNFVTFDSTANQLAKNIYLEMTGSKNAGISVETILKLKRFNEFVGSSVTPQSARLSSSAPNFRSEANELQSQLNSAILNRATQIGTKNTEINTLLKDATSKEIKEKLTAYMNELDYIGKNPTNDIVDKMAEEVAAPFLEKGFNEYQNDRNAIIEILKHPALKYFTQPSLPTLSKTPYSSDLRTLGRMYQGGDDWSRFLSVKFFLSIFLSAVFDVFVGFLFYKLISRRD